MGPATAPSRVRLQVLALLCTLSMVTYLDRACYGITLKYMQADLGFSMEQVGWLTFAFSIAYALFEIPGGWLGDRFGPRKTLLRIVLSWSLFTALTGLIWPVPSWPWFAFTAMFWVRFLFGAGEAGAYPNIARALQNWFPVREKAGAQGAVWMSARLMGGLTPLVVTALLYSYTAADGSTHTAWRHVYWLFGGIGGVWCVVAWFLLRDRPEQHPAVNHAELDQILSDRKPSDGEGGHHQVPWLRLIGSVNLWALCVMYFAMSYSWYFAIQYYAKFLDDHFSINRTTWGWGAPFATGGPLLAGTFACLVGGFLSDRQTRLWGRRWGRRSTGLLGHGIAGGCYLLAILALRMEQPLWFVLLIALGGFCNDLTMGSCWAVCLDIGGKHAGVVAGCMNMVGNLGGAATALFSAQLYEAHAFETLFASYAAMYGLAVLCWLRIDADEPVV